MTISASSFLLRRLAGAGLLSGLALLAGCERPPVEFVQNGPRGTAMASVYNPRTLAAQAPVNKLPDPVAPAAAGGPPATTVFKNVQVLKDLSVGEFTRTMLAITAWVAPEQGCNYCHAPGEDLSSDKLYTKVVARKMLEMTRHVNADWKTHVAATGVTCYTCHRGQPVPAQVWFNDPGPRRAGGVSADNAQQNHPALLANLSSLPYDPLTPFLQDAQPIRVYGTTALPNGNRMSIKQAEWTYSLMTHMSQALGVNCTYCHNTQSFGSWDKSPPQRATAYYGIRMARDLNNAYLQPLTATFPAGRKGPTGDVAKVSCGTCHQGAFKPLNGAQLLKDHAEALGGGAPAPAAAAPAEKQAAVAVPAAEVTPTAAPAAATALEGTIGKVLFAKGKDTLSADAKQVLSQAIDALKKNPDAAVTLSGYADKSGNADKNMELAKQRAFTVRDALKDGGIDAARIKLQKPEFVAEGADAQARRVDINVAGK